jgi:hypothetical protein
MLVPGTVVKLHVPVDNIPAAATVQEPAAIQDIASAAVGRQQQLQLRIQQNHVPVLVLALLCCEWLNW